MKILIFTEGTILMPSTGRNVSREERVKQSINNDPSVDNFATYIGIGNAADKIQEWQNQGADICYLTSRRNSEEVNDIKNILANNNFPEGELHYRKNDQQYIDVVKEIMPDILIEDDCESIGGTKEMILTYMNDELKSQIKTIVVKEFDGIEHLSDNVKDL